MYNKLANGGKQVFTSYLGNFILIFKTIYLNVTLSFFIRNEYNMIFNNDLNRYTSFSKDFND